VKETAYICLVAVADMQQCREDVCFTAFKQAEMTVHELPKDNQAIFETVIRLTGHHQYCY
jgi:hypothetical protein